MESSFSPTFLGLARELRDAIYDVLAEVEDLSSIMHTCRQLRKEILSRMPGSELIDLEQTYDDETLRSQFRGSIEVENLFIIAEPWYSPGAVLKFEVIWRKTRGNGDEPICESSWVNTRSNPFEPASEPIWRTSRWTIRDLSSPMARYTLFYCPRRITITFEAAVSGHFQIALMILRAKVCDICQIMQTMRSKTNFSYDWSSEVIVRFNGGKDPTRHPSARKSFWEMRPKRFEPQLRCIRCPRTYPCICIKKSHQILVFDVYPYFYECLAVPLFYYAGWAPCEVTFEVKPATNRSSYFRQAHIAPGDPPPQYLGADALFREMFSHFRRQRCRLYRERRPPAWYLSPDLQLEIMTVINRLQEFTLDAHLLLGRSDCEESRQLEDYVAGKRDAHACNPFAWFWKVFKSYCSGGDHQYQDGVVRSSWEDKAIMAEYIRWADRSNYRWIERPRFGLPSNEWNRRRWT